jgi:glycosyltransferase involved in cell wall biosynthesis
MRIGHITYRQRPEVGGMETYVGMLLRVFAAAGYSQRVYQTRTAMDGDDLRIVRRPPLLPKQIGYSLGLLARLPDLVHENCLIVSNAEYYLPVAWHRGTIVLSHGATWTSDASPRRRRIRRLAAEIAFRRAGRYVFNDTFAMRELGLAQPPQTGMFSEVAPGKWFIPNCVDTDRFSPGSGSENLARLQPILVPRNLTSPRGVDLAISAFAQFVQHYPQTSLVIVGDTLYDNKGSIRYRAELMNQITTLGLSGRVIFLGSVAGRDMPGIYRSALMTLIPTRASEGTSLAALESMACGVATICSAVEGLLDLPAVHCAAGADALFQTMMSTFAERERIGREQRAAVESIYTIANWSKAWLRVIESLPQARAEVRAL